MLSIYMKSEHGPQLARGPDFEHPCFRALVTVLKPRAVLQSFEAKPVEQYCLMYYKKKLFWALKKMKMKYSAELNDNIVKI